MSGGEKEEVSEQLLEAVKRNDEASVRRLLRDINVDPNYLSEKVFYHCCAVCHYVRVQTFLLQDWTPLMKACEGGWEPLVELLLENPANVNKRDSVSDRTSISLI